MKTKVIDMSRRVTVNRKSGHSSVIVNGKLDLMTVGSVIVRRFDGSIVYKEDSCKVKNVIVKV